MSKNTSKSVFLPDESKMLNDAKKRRSNELKRQILQIMRCRIRSFCKWRLCSKKRVENNHTDIIKACFC